MLNKLYTQADFLNLTKDDIDIIQKTLNMNIPDDRDQYQYLFENINIIEDNEITHKIIADKLLAGQVSVKWYKYTYTNRITKDTLKQILDSKKLTSSETIEDKCISKNYNDIVNVVSEDNIYTLKIFILDGYKRKNNGIECKREPVTKNIVVKIDIENCWIEIRASDSRCDKIVGILTNIFHFENLDAVRLLNRYNNDINIFKDSLIDGFYLNYKAIPCQNTELTEDDGILMVKMINIIDDYFENKDGDLLLSKLETINYDTDGLSFSDLLLAGVDNLGMKIRNDSEKDMTKQTLYNLLRDKLIEDSSHIRFSNYPQGVLYTIRVGLKTNSIIFKSSVTEEVITYIREKIL